MINIHRTLFLKRLHWILPLITVATWLSYAFLDRPLAFYFKNNSIYLESLAKAVNTLIDPTPNILAWLMVFFVVKYLCRQIRLGYEVLFVSISLNLTNLVVLLIKRLTARLRPSYLLDKDLYGFSIIAMKSSQYSFPSGHAVTIFTIMCAFSILHRKYTALFLFIGFLLAFCRVVVDAHYLSDVIAAFGVAMIFTELVHVCMKKDFHTFSLLKF